LLTLDIVLCIAPVTPLQTEKADEQTLMSDVFDDSPKAKGKKKAPGAKRGGGGRRQGTLNF
jgi:hypothetical protein